MFQALRPRGLVRQDHSSISLPYCRGKRSLACERAQLFPHPRLPPTTIMLSEHIVLGLLSTRGCLIRPPSCVSGFTGFHCIISMTGMTRLVSSKSISAPQPDVFPRDCSPDAVTVAVESIRFREHAHDETHVRRSPNKYVRGSDESTTGGPVISLTYLILNSSRMKMAWGPGFNAV